MILEGMADALQNFATLQLWVSILIGLVIGFIFGIVPGVSGTTALALLLPFTFVMTPDQALPLMVAIMASVFMGGSIPSILLNVPGDPPTAASCLDGYPMSKNGEAGRALGASRMANAMAHVLTAILALALIPLVLPLVMVVRSADMVFMMLLGISFIAVLGAGSMVKGLISGIMGFLIAFIGFQARTGVARFTFGSLYLYDGITISTIALGLFALPEMIALITEGGSIARNQVTIKGMSDVMRGVRDVFKHWTLVVRGNLIGFIIGVLPGIGASSAAFIAYGHAKQISKEPERFGKGSVEGVIAPESALNSEEAGALVTTLALGIPGNAPMALLMGAMVMVGLVPGPEMLTKHMGLSLTLVWVIAAVGILGLAITLPLCPYLAGIARIPGKVLAPIIIAITFVGAYTAAEQIEDVIATFALGIVGLLMRQYGYNRAALFLAYVLGALAEKYFFIALAVDGPFFFVRPISLTLIVGILAVIFWSPVKGMLTRWKAAA